MSRSLALILFAATTTVWAQTPPETSLPPVLKDWRAWVLKDLDYRACPFLAGHAPDAQKDFICAWPGRLTLAAGADGATFSVHWRVEANSWVPLPGDGDQWPQQVTVNAQRQPTLAHEGQPAVWLTPGNYEISGKISWRERPQALTVPQDIGLVALSVDGKLISPLQRQGTLLTLGRSVATAPEADNIDVRVYRMLVDGVPANLTTQLRIGVSGQAREEVLGPVLPEGYAPLALEGAWPARLDAEGKLHVQVQPGSETFTLQARALAPLAGATAHIPAGAWPSQEIWSYAADPRLRVTAANSAVQVDPRQAEVPPEWQALPAFALGDGGKLVIEERSRGLGADEANRLTLQREAWLDFDGHGWFARDHLGGTLAQGWRFDVAAPFTLEQATARNSRRSEGGEALLVTRGAKPEFTGVEWRTPNVDLAAGVRVAARATMPVAGWQQTFDNVQATLHFPFGYKLLAAPGADSASGSWIAGWTLLDVFLCAVVALLAWRLFGLVGAVVVVVYLILGYQEAGSPLWSLLIVLGLALIVRALPEGKLQRVTQHMRVLGLLVLVLIALPFVATQVRDALYPQLEAQGALGNYGGVYRHRVSRNADMGASQNAPAGMAGGEMNQIETANPVVVLESPSPAAVESPPPPPADLAPSEAPRMRAEPKVLEKSKSTQDKLETIVATASNIRRVDLIDHYAQNTVVQTGSGLPSWNLGSTAWLSWSGPVVATQSVHLLIAPPWLVRPLRILLVALLAWLIGRLFRASLPSRPLRGAALGAGAIALCGLICMPHAQAQSIPSEDLLQQLRQRLIEAPKCAPECASVAEAQVGANGDSISVALEAHAGERVALPLPGDATDAMLKSVQVDGVAADAIARDGEGTAWLALGRGVHRVQLEFTATADKIALTFPLRPARVLFSGKGWDASGLSDDRLLSGTLALARAREDGGEKPSTGAQQFPPYVEVTRSIMLGLEWSASTHVRRIAPKTGGFTVRVPILPGEHITSGGFKVVDGRIEAAFADGTSDANWGANFDKGTKLTLTAPALADHAEIWRVTVSPTWHVEFSGVPGVGLAPGEDPNDYRNFEFHPLPGETLTLAVTKPEPAQGAQRAIDSVNLHSEAGQHAATHVLSFILRASQGGDQAITLPKDAEVLAVQRDNETLNLRALDSKLTLPVAPGTHRYVVRFRDGNEMSALVRTPALALGLPAANISIIEQLPADRWLLAAWGPPVGPAVLYWGELIVMILIAYALAHTRRTRLKFHHWLLLGLGFSTFSWIALLLVVAWLFAFDWRARGEMPASRWHFNLLQVVLAVLAVVALIALASAIPQGLLGSPDMHVTGNGSYAQYLQWFADRSGDALPQAGGLSLPLWVYKVLMLAWALWLANAVIGWLRDGFAAWTKDGYWRAAPPKAADAQPAQPAP
jgi:hypothetical protein